MTLTQIQTGEDVVTAIKAVVSHKRGNIVWEDFEEPAPYWGWADAVWINKVEPLAHELVYALSGGAEALDAGKLQGMSSEVFEWIDSQTGDIQGNAAAYVRPIAVAMDEAIKILRVGEKEWFATRYDSFQIQVMDTLKVLEHRRLKQAQ